MKKIVITGALGYIGVELSKIYVGQENVNLICIDNRFFSERVQFLQKNGFEFISCDILDKNKMTEVLKDADLVYHLAGITDVAYSKFEDNDQKNFQIRENGIQGTKNVLNLSPKNCKIIFPSTHVVYEGLQEEIRDIDENYPTSTTLTYATQKRISEDDVRSSGLDYIIFRLGSVYGLSNDTMRLNIMPNLFSRITSQDGKINLFGGENLKSLVSVKDVARALKFIAESSIKNETFHLTNENMDIKSVAKICKKYNPKVEVIENKSNISNGYSPSYTLSNKKLLSTGFKFLYNIEDSIKEMIYNWSNKKHKEYIDGFETECRVCSSKNIKDVVSLGLSPLANNLLSNKNEDTDFFPLELIYCSDCHNVQLNYVVDPKKMFSNYLYVSSTTKSFREHFEKAADNYIKYFNLNSESLVVDIGSNDGIALIPFKKNGVKTLGVEPAKNLKSIAENNGIKTISEFFTNKTVDSIIPEFGKADLVLASNVFAHSDEIEEITSATFRLLKDEGSFIVEIQYLLDTINDLTFDNIYHEHVNYWSLHSLTSFFNNLNLEVYKVERINTHGGSLRAYIKRNPKEIDSSVKDLLNNEKEFGITNHQSYIDFANKIKKSKENVVKNISTLRKNNKTIVGYGAPAKATTTLNYYELSNKDIDYIVEDNSLKHNKIIPGTGITIFPKQKIYEEIPDVIIVFAWNFLDEIKRNNQDLIDKGVKFISIKELQY